MQTLHGALVRECVCTDTWNCLNMTTLNIKTQLHNMHIVVQDVYTAFTVSYAFWSWLSAQQSDRIILWEHYGNNIRLPKHYSVAGESSVTSDTTIWQGAQLAIHFLHQVIIITSDIIINQTSNRPCAACLTPSHTCQVCAQTVYTQSISEACKHTLTHARKHRVPQKKEQRLRAKSHRIHHQRKH